MRGGTTRSETQTEARCAKDIIPGPKRPRQMTVVGAPISEHGEQERAKAKLVRRLGTSFWLSLVWSSGCPIFCKSQPEDLADTFFVARAAAKLYRAQPVNARAGVILCVHTSAAQKTPTRSHGNLHPAGLNLGEAVCSGFEGLGHRPGRRPGKGRPGPGGKTSPHTDSKRFLHQDSLPKPRTVRRTPRLNTYPHVKTEDLRGLWERIAFRE